MLDAASVPVDEIWMGWQTWPITKENMRLMRVVMDCPAERVSRGCTSLEYSQPRGPQDQAYADMYTHMNASTNQAAHTCAPVIASVMPITTCDQEELMSECRP